MNDITPTTLKGTVGEFLRNRSMMSSLCANVAAISAISAMFPEQADDVRSVQCY
jgi:hypothetical protein